MSKSVFNLKPNWNTVDTSIPGHYSPQEIRELDRQAKLDQEYAEAEAQANAEEQAVRDSFAQEDLVQFAANSDWGM